ncbi:hypothetical protein MJO29_014243, partial [Puccinia striiformis f. sp. tritici]
HIPHTPAEFERDSFLFEGFLSCARGVCPRKAFCEGAVDPAMASLRKNGTEDCPGCVWLREHVCNLSPHEPSHLCPHVGSLTPPELPQIESQTVAADLLTRSLAHGMRSN